MDKIVRKVYEFSDVPQVEVNELRKNPFHMETYAAVAEAAPSLAAEEQAIKLLIDNVFEAEKRKDIGAILSFYSDDVIVQPPNAPQFQGMEALRNFYVEFLKLLVSIDGGSTKTVISTAGDMAYDIGWNRTVFEAPGGTIEDEGKYLTVMKKINGEWKIVAISYSSEKTM